MLVRQVGLVNGTLIRFGEPQRRPLWQDRKRSTTRPGIKTPTQQREAKKYANPIPSREFILQTLTDHGAPLAFEQVAETSRLTDEEDLTALERRLAAMVRDGQLVRNRIRCLLPGQPPRPDHRAGHRPSGRLRFRPAGRRRRRPVSLPKEMRGLFHEDRVVVRVTGRDRRGRLEGAVVEVLERNTRSVVGRLYQEGGVGFVVPDSKRIDHDIVISERPIGGASQGQIVVVEIIEQPTRAPSPWAASSRCSATTWRPGMEIEMAIRSHDLPNDWPVEVEPEISGLRPKCPEAAKAGRIDLRKLPLVTIDGEDARDFDDAVYCEPKPKGWKLLVAIADVSHYVRPGTALDREAQKRGTSVYFPERVIPMLPEVLSNGLCSINPEEDRLCMVCEMLLNRTARSRERDSIAAVMRSHARLTYNEVAKILVDGDKELCAARMPRPAAPGRAVQGLPVAARAREERGAIDFDTQESKIVFGDDRKIENIVP